MTAPHLSCSIGGCARRGGEAPRSDHRPAAQARRGAPAERSRRRLPQPRPGEERGRTTRIASDGSRRGRAPLLVVAQRVNVPLIGSLRRDRMLGQWRIRVNTVLVRRIRLPAPEDPDTRRRLRDVGGLPQARCRPTLNASTRTRSYPSHVTGSARGDGPISRRQTRIRRTVPLRFFGPGADPGWPRYMDDIEWTSCTRSELNLRGW